VSSVEDKIGTISDAQAQIGVRGEHSEPLLARIQGATRKQVISCGGAL